jgi:carboxyl-terminal processing protease
MSSLIRFFLILFLSLISISAVKIPDLSSKDISRKAREILKSHVCHKKLTPELATRILQNYLEELDPTKIYFTEPEISRFNEPDEQMKLAVINSFKTSDFSIFYEIHQLLLNGIERRALLEEKLESPESMQLPSSEELKKLPWPQDIERLKERLSQIRHLQKMAASKLDDESQEIFFKRIEKQRSQKEASWKLGAPAALTYLLKAFASSLDAHTTYLTPSEASQFMIQVQQSLSGIGAQLRDDLDGLTVVRILENSPASRCNLLKINDKIIAVNHEPVIGMDLTEAVELIRGEKSTDVHLTLLRPLENKETEKMEIVLTRDEIILEETRLKTELEHYGDEVIATFKLFSFYQDSLYNSGDDLQKAIESVKKEHHLSGVILDLRGNAGGLFNQAVSVAGLFLEKGIVVSFKDELGKLQHLRKLEGPPVWNGPLVVLVDQASASAAEIVAQTLQDYGRALIVGDPNTFGKGSVQTLTLDLLNSAKPNPQGEYKVTRWKYYTVSGKSPQLTGVISDIPIPGLLSKIEIGEKFSKFPLDSDEVSPHFEDDLSDLSLGERLRIPSDYKEQRQKKLKTYTAHLDVLKRNTASRLEKNLLYQKTLTEIDNKNFDSPLIDWLAQTDIQHTEALNLTKDLIFLLKTNNSP